jgi:hypothetical protein
VRLPPIPIARRIQTAICRPKNQCEPNCLETRSRNIGIVLLEVAAASVRPPLLIATREIAHAPKERLRCGPCVRCRADAGYWCAFRTNRLAGALAMVRKSGLYLESDSLGVS